MDLSPFIAWGVALAGGALALLVGLRRARSEAATGWAAAFGVALALGLCLTFVQVALHSFCVDQLKLCVSRGDVNMSYWFQSFFAIPLYWLVAGAAWQVGR